MQLYSCMRSKGVTARPPWEPERDLPKGWSHAKTTPMNEQTRSQSTKKMDVIKGEEAKRVGSGWGDFRPTSDELGLRVLLGYSDNRRMHNCTLYVLTVR